MIVFKRKKSRFYNFILKFKSIKDKTGVFIAKKSLIKEGTSIGDGTRINGKIIIKGKDIVKIGKYCAIGEDVKIISSNHDMEVINLQYSLQKRIGLNNKIDKFKRGVTIDNNVWIGDSVIILSGVNIGNGAVLAAGSIITKNVKAYSIVGGVPAKFIKSRFSQEKIEEIEKSKWWDWSIEEMQLNKSFFK